MKKHSAFLLLAFALSGCSTTAHLYPVEGTLSKTVPLPEIEAQVNGIMGNTGSISLTMPDGEQCSGRWSSAAGQTVSAETVNLWSQYGSVGGTSIKVANQGGVNRGEAVLKCDKGGLVEAEFYTGSGTANGFGKAKDNRGNVFKVIF